MTAREKKLAAAVGLLVLLWAGNWAWNWYSDWHQQATAARLNARTALQDAEFELTKTRSAVRDLQSWQQRSLPADANVAQSQYRAWLIEQLKAANLKLQDVTPIGSGQRTDAYRGLSYVVDAEGDLAAVVKFLDSFYRSGQLHKISLLRLAPLATGSGLRATINVEALVVDGTKRTDGLTELASDRLALDNVEEYVDRITGRDLFAEYTPPKPPPPPPPKVVDRPPPKPPEKPKFDDSKHAHLTGLVKDDSGWKAWVTVRTTDERFRFTAGDEVKIGLFEGRVAAIDRRRMLVEIDGETLAVSLGDSLRDGEQVTGSSGI